MPPGPGTQACWLVFPKERIRSTQVPRERAVGTSYRQASTDLAFPAELLAMHTG